ncbi:hypothetical protein E2562_034762 [Oryza meyeriana var. granulata]|uniref:Uncharacterized protein n=1 Tax=Oryza meyeriana var. granulata TaxID=110450 RepID=A0A6G1CJ78_9ORYZ|nr:hypothetical protein E2562_034762 [Oryza meyeriana var. granulata]
MGDSKGIRRTTTMLDKIGAGTEAWFDGMAVGHSTMPANHVFARIKANLPRQPVMLCEELRTLSLQWRTKGSKALRPPSAPQQTCMCHPPRRLMRHQHPLARPAPRRCPHAGERDAIPS